MAGFISGTHFYHATTRKVVSVFGSLFNNIKIVRRDQAGNTLNVEKVPLAYGPAQKFLARIEEQGDLTDPKLAIKLPRISFEMTSMSYDATAKTSRFNQDIIRNADGSTGVARPYVPYILTFEVNVLAKAQDDGLQILEQILPTFHPEYNVSVKYTSNDTADMPIVLDGVSVNDDYESDFISRRILMYTLTFSVKVRYYGEITTNNAVIKQVMVDFWNSPAGGEFFEGQGSRVELYDYNYDDPWTVFEYLTPIPTSYSATIVFTAPATGTFEVNEIVNGSNGGRGRIIAVIDTSTIVVNPLVEYFEPSAIVTGATSGATGTISTITLASDEPA